MAICRICGKDIGFFGAVDISLTNRQSKMYPATISICKSCADLMGFMNNGDAEACNKIHQFVDSKNDDLLKEFISSWDDKYRQNKKDDGRDILKGQPYYINESQRETINLIRKKAREKAEKDLLYYVIGVRGRSIKIYPYKCVINTDVTIGSILTNNATDGEKTIYYKDCVGIQYKRPGATLGYLQFETAANTMNNEKSNTFNENSFTFEKNTELMDEIYEYIIGIMDEIKAL